MPTDSAPSPEPRSDVQAELGGGMYTYYEQGTLPGTEEPTEQRSELTNSQQAFRAARIAESMEQSIIPSPATLKGMTEAQRRLNLEQIAKIKAEMAGRRALAETGVAIEPVMQQPEEQLPLPFEG
jgi:hypothetical protein